MTMADWKDREAPTLEVIEALALAAVEKLPPAFAGPAKAVVFRIDDFPPEDVLEELGIDDPFELTGFYEGVPMTAKSVMDIRDRPDTVWLFRRAILDEWAERGNATLGELVAHIVVHELAHHFGWSDDDIAQIDRWWE